jgi:hypothetical protein
MGFWPARKSRRRTHFESQNTVAMITPLKKLFSLFGGGGGGGAGEWRVSTAYLVFLIQDWSSGPKSHQSSQLSPNSRLLVFRIFAEVE